MIIKSKTTYKKWSKTQYKPRGRYGLLPATTLYGNAPQTLIKSYNRLRDITHTTLLSFVYTLSVIIKADAFIPGVTFLSPQTPTDKVLRIAKPNFRSCILYWSEYSQASFYLYALRWISDPPELTFGHP